MVAIFVAVQINFGVSHEKDSNSRDFLINSAQGVLQVNLLNIFFVD